MNADLILMFGALVLLAISGLLVFCFTEAKGKNTVYARKESRRSAPTLVVDNSEQTLSVDNSEQRKVVTH